MRTIIFSKDRACQLHLLLESIAKNDKVKLFDDIHVIYTASNYQFTLGYIYLKQRFPMVHFRKQESFRKDTMHLLVHSKSELCVFFVDDIIVYRPIDVFEHDIEILFDKYGDTLACLSLRLGYNTTMLYQTGQMMEFPRISSTDGKIVTWNRHTMPPMENFNYPLSVDGHIFRTEKILHWTAMTPFSNPNEFESGLARDRAPEAPPIMACFPASVIVNSPINRVQDQFANKYGEQYSFSSRDLNDRYLQGDTIDLSSIDPESVNASHQEFEVKFK